MLRLPGWILLRVAREPHVLAVHARLNELDCGIFVVHALQRRFCAARVRLICMHNVHRGHVRRDQRPHVLQRLSVEHLPGFDGSGELHSLRCDEHYTGRCGRLGLLDVPHRW